MFSFGLNQLYNGKLSHEKWAPTDGLGYFLGDEILPSYIGIIINYDIRIPDQPSRIQWKSKGPRFFCCGKKLLVWIGGLRFFKRGVQ